MIDEAKTHLGRVLVEGIRANPDLCGFLPEAWTPVNKASRAVIRAYRRTGRAWLVHFTPRKGRHGYRSGDAVALEPYTWGMVYNFGADAVVPTYDRRLIELIREREINYTGVKDDARRVDAIIARVEEIGGALLFWS